MGSQLKQPPGGSNRASSGRATASRCRRASCPRPTATRRRCWACASTRPPSAGSGAGAPVEWLLARGRGLGSVRFSGKIPAGEVILPRPHGATLGEVRSGGRSLPVAQTADGLPLIYLPAESELTFEVELREAPRPTDDEPELPGEAAELLKFTVDGAELPQELHTMIEALLSGGLSPLSRALQVRDFIAERYRYDPGYLEDERVARWLARAARGSSNTHLSALHAGRSGRSLGAGVCYELNALCCELLRRVGVPAAVCTGWVLDRGQIDEPDHLWALALLPTDQGLLGAPRRLDHARRGPAGHPVAPRRGLPGPPRPRPGRPGCRRPPPGPRPGPGPAPPRGRP